MKLSIKRFMNASFGAGIIGALVLPGSAQAAGQTLGDIANNFANSFASVGNATQTFCWTMAFVIAAAACFKFAAYARDTEREKVSTPLLLMLVAALFFAVPMVLNTGAVTVWGSSTTITQSSHSTGGSILP